MWFCFNDSFLSVVKKGGEPQQLCVRARLRGDIERVFPDAQVIESLHTDYRFRAFIDRATVIQKVTERLLSLDYPNFKSSVEDHERHDAYLDIWSVMYGRQQREMRRENRASFEERQPQLSFGESREARNVGTTTTTRNDRHRA